MNHYCCIIDAIMPEGTGTRVLMVVARTGTRLPVTSPIQLITDPPIVGRVTSLAKSFQGNGDYGHAFIIAMAKEIESAMRRGSFPNSELVIPDIFVTNLMQTNLPEFIGQHYLGIIAYAFSA